MPKTLAPGEIMPLSDKAPDGAGRIVACEFNHQGRTIVRLVPEALADAEQLALGVLGIAQDNKVLMRAVGSSMQRAVGFPAWPIMHDPDNAHHALNLVGDLEWARKSASNQPKKVKERFDGLVASLTASAPHFVPTLLEELARIFHEVGNDQYAKQYFSKARETERSFAIQIDPDRHKAAFLEFSASGVVGAKELTNEVNAALERFADPRAAFDYLLGINVESVRSGVTPYAFIARDLRKAGKAAGLGAGEVDDLLFEQILDLKATFEAAEGFFKAVHSSLARYARKNATARALLRARKPRQLEIESYFALLEAAGALDDLRENKEELAAWLVEFLEMPYSLTHAKENVVATILEARDELDGTEIKIELGYCSFDVLDALAECGVVFRGIDAAYSGSWPNWKHWFSPEYDSSRRSLVHAARNEQLRPMLVSSLSPEDISTHLDLLLEHQGASDLLLGAIEKQITELHTITGSLPQTEFFLDIAKHFSHPKLKALAGERIYDLFAFDPIQQFQLAVQRGTFVEYSWPAFEAYYSTLLAKSKTEDPYVKVCESYPAAALVVDSAVGIVDGDSVIAETEMPAGYRSVAAVRHIDDHIGVAFQESGSWKEGVFWDEDVAVETESYFRAGPGYSLQIHSHTGPSRLTGSGVIGVGDTDWGFNRSGIFCVDAEHGPAFTSLNSSSHIWESGKFLAVDPAETAVQEKLGLFYAKELDFNPVPIGKQKVWLDDDNSTVIPVQPSTTTSPMGIVDLAAGVHVNLVYGIGEMRYHPDKHMIVSPYGTFETARSASAVLERPGGGVWLAGTTSKYGATLIDVASDLPIASSYETAGKAHILHRLPRACWHQLQVRDELASTLMRSYTREQAEQAMTAEDGLEELLAQQLQTTDSTIITAVSHILHGVKAQQRAFDTMREAVGAAASAEETQLLPQTIDFLTRYPAWGSSLDEPSKVLATAAVVSSFIADPDAELPALLSGEDLSLGLLRFANKERLAVALFGAPGFAELLDADESIAQLVSLFREFTKARIFGHGWRVVQVRGKKLSPLTSVDGCLVLHHTYAWDSSGRVDVCEVLVPAGTTSVAGYGISEPDQDESLTAQEFLRCLDLIENSPKDRRLDPEIASDIARGTALSPEAVTYLFGGMVGFGDYHTAFLSKQQREFFGFNASQAKGARAQISDTGEKWKKLLSAAVLLEHPESYITTGPDPSAVINCWQRRFGEPHIHLTSEEYAAIAGSEYSGFSQVAEPLFRKPEDIHFTENREFFHSGWYLLETILRLFDMMQVQDERRRELLKKLEWLRKKTVEAFRDPELKKHLNDVEFGEDYYDPRFRYSVSHTPQKYRVLLEGHLDGFIDAPRTAPSASAAGFAQDPLVSAPEVVNTASAELGVSVDAARYFVQLLALVNATDANIRLWNGWKKKQLDAAAAELVAKGLVLEAKRTGAGRSRFLPGGWLIASNGEKPMEVWKAPHYIMWRGAKAYPVLAGCPVTVPYEQLFADVWRRYAAGDRPGYEELKTTRYRPRRR